MSDLMFFIEMLLVFGSVLGWAVWEVWSLGREQRRARRRLSAERSRHAEGQDGPHQGRAEPPQR